MISSLISGYVVSKGSYEAAINLTDHGFQLTIDHPKQIALITPNGIIDPTSPESTTISIDGENQGSLEYVGYHSFSLNSNSATEDYSFFIIAAENTAEYILIQIDSETGELISTQLQPSTNYIANNPFEPILIKLDSSKPIFVSDDTVHINENTGPNKQIYTAVASDNSDNISYTLKSDNYDDASSFAIDPLTGEVTLLVDPDFEDESSYSFTVVASDQAANSSEQQVTLSINDVNEPPEALRLTTTVKALPENSDTRRRIKLGNIAISDDALGSNVITLAGDDATSFEVDGTSLFLKAGTKLDYESKTTYFVRLSANDPSLNGTTSVTADYRLSVNDIAEFPFISSLNAVKTKKKVTTFSLKTPLVVGGKQLDTAIIGTKKKDAITGSSKNEILAGFKGRDVLRGGHGADGFLFDKPVGFGKKKMDKILDFNVAEHDKILVDKKAFGLGKKIKFKAVKNKSQLKKMSKKKFDFVYESKTGFLYFNQNYKKPGWGVGGLFAHLQNKEELFQSSFEIV